MQSFRPDSDGMSLDELAEHTGVPQRTIRFYRSSGLVAAPRRVGRRAVYDRTHLDRVRVISALRERGLGLEPIARIVQDPRAERSLLSELVQLSEELRRPWFADRAADLSELELLELLGTSDLEVLDLLVTAGVTTRTTKPRRSYQVPSVAVLEVLGDALAAGIRPHAVLAAWRTVEESMTALAEALVTQFTSSTGEAPYVPGGLQAGEQELRALAQRALQTSFGRHIASSIAARVEQGAVLDLATYEDMSAD